MNYGRATAFGVGMIHGVGAETPTQVVIFLTAAGAGGKFAGVVLLGCFLIGLVSSNSLIAVASTFGLLGATKNGGGFAWLLGFSRLYPCHRGGVLPRARPPLPLIRGGGAGRSGHPGCV